MTESDRRQHPRFNPQGLKAKIFLESPGEPSQYEGDVIDISLTGIKIRLDEQPEQKMDGKIKIDLFLPDTGIPFSITGILKHQANPTDLGLHYVDNGADGTLDRFMFECIKLAKN